MRVRNDYSEINQVIKFKYLSIALTDNGLYDAEIRSRIGRDE